MRATWRYSAFGMKAETNEDQLDPTLELGILESLDNLEGEGSDESSEEEEEEADADVYGFIESRFLASRANTSKGTMGKHGQKSGAESSTKGTIDYPKFSRSNSTAYDSNASDACGTPPKRDLKAEGKVKASPPALNLLYQVMVRGTA